MPKSITIRPATDADRDAISRIFQEVIVAGDTYPCDREMSRADALAHWFQPTARVYIAEENDEVLGSYLIRPNQSGGGAHVANAAFIVASSARGKGIGRAMGEHCLSEARVIGFRAMQFNFVVATNKGAVELWQDLGMKIIATLPGAFQHPTEGYVDVYVMFQEL